MGNGLALLHVILAPNVLSTWFNSRLVSSAVHGCHGYSHPENSSFSEAQTSPSLDWELHKSPRPGFPNIWAKQLRKHEWIMAKFTATQTPNKLDGSCSTIRKDQQLRRIICDSHMIEPQTWIVWWRRTSSWNSKTWWIKTGTSSLSQTNRQKYQQPGVF